MLSIINILLGIGLLVWGRKLFWLFVGAAGFLAGVSLVTIGWHGSEAVAIIVGILAGLVCAALAVFFKTISIGLTGFLGGGALLIMVAGWLGINNALPSFLIYIIGGVLGIILVSKMFDWAIIIISSIVGASTIIGAVKQTGPLGWLGMIALIAVGIAIQARGLSEEKSKK
jgi:hypothetical protein